jgi:hypothetical protein
LTALFGNNLVGKVRKAGKTGRKKGISESKNNKTRGTDKEEHTRHPFPKKKAVIFPTSGKQSGKYVLFFA